MKLSVPQEKVVVTDVQYILTWSQCFYYLLFSCLQVRLSGQRFLAKV